MTFILIKAIEDYFATGFVDEVVVVNNNAEEGTNEEVKKTKARLVHEQKQGYGYGYQRGIREATGDQEVPVAPCGSFLRNGSGAQITVIIRLTLLVGRKCSRRRCKTNSRMN